MKKFVFIVLMCVWSTTFAGSCDWFYFNNQEPIYQENPVQELCFDTFVVLYATEKKTAIWSAERVTKEGLIAGNGIKREDDFHQEKRLPKYARGTLADYLNSKKDKGHLTPYRNHPLSPDIDTLANTVPQAPILNRGKWANLEEDIRDQVLLSGNDMFVITGAIFIEPIETIGENEIPVPSHMYKVVVESVTQNIFVYVAKNENYANIDEWELDKLEELIGVVFFQK